MRHPSKDIRDAALWYGVEVEGSSTGLYTAFLSRSIAEARIRDTLLNPKVEQLFLTEYFHEWAWFRRNVAPLVKVPIVIGRHANRHEILEARAAVPKARIFVRVFGIDWLDALTDTDEVSLGNPFNLTTFVVGTGVRSLPYQYEDDAL